MKPSKNPAVKNLPQNYGGRLSKFKSTCEKYIFTGENLI
jgi:hypothetical protein